MTILIMNFVGFSTLGPTRQNRKAVLIAVDPL